MGGGSWSDDEHKSRTHARDTGAGGARYMSYTADISAGVRAAAVHDDLKPTVKAGPKSPFAGQVMRESRDSDEHPESLAIAVLFDVTGSMGRIPLVLQKKLGGLMQILISKGYVPHPQILFGANGDANSDSAPLQVGQFESSLTMDHFLDNIWVEGGGGGQHKETYELGLYFLAKHTSVDCWEKRAHKGYIFVIGDEAFYDHVRRAQVRDIIGDSVERDIPTEDVVLELTEKWNVFHVHVETGYGDLTRKPWQLLLGERCLELKDPDNVAELIAMTIGLNEGTVDIDTGAAHLKDAGLDAGAVKSMSTALAPLAAAGAMSKATGTATGLAPASASGVDRL